MGMAFPVPVYGGIFCLFYLRLGKLFSLQHLDHELSEPNG